MQKVIEKMKSIVKKRVKHWQTDLDIDIEFLGKNPECKKFVWVVRECGTNMYPVRELGDRLVKYLFGFKRLTGIAEGELECLEKHHGDADAFFIIENDRMHEVSREKAVEWLKEQYEIKKRRL